jgi:hypothetical protein
MRAVSIESRHVVALLFRTILLMAISLFAVGADAHAQGLESQSDLIATIVRKGGNKTATAHDPRFGDALVLSASGTAAPHLDASLQMHGGTISFWVKPQWRLDSTDSHTLMSARWNDSRQSYLAISEGWWEPSGIGRLYFIVSNEDTVHCSSERRLPPQIWSLITVTWSSGDHGFCKLFVDDELRATTERSWSGGGSIKQIDLGTDEGTTIRHGRTADASIAALKILSYPVTHRDVIQRYKSEEDPQDFYSKKWAWLDQPTDITGSSVAGTAVPVKNFQRVIFDEDMAWATGPASIDNILRRISEAGFNVYVPCIWHGRGALFPSHVAPPDPRLKDLFAHGWDPLQYLVKKAHAQRIAVYPGFTVVRREDSAHPEWAERGTPQGAYDIHRPEFREFATDLMIDAVSRYDIDGVNLDYIRAMGICTSDFCQHDYRDRAGFNLLEDNANGAPVTTARQRIQSWQDSAVGALVHDFSNKARALKPGLIISIDGYAMSSESQRPLEGRDELSWANRGWIDIIFHMDYNREVDITLEQSARSHLTDPSKLWLLVSNYDLIDSSAAPRPGQWIRKVIDFAKVKQRDKGIGVYLYGQLSDEQIAALQSNSRPQHKAPKILADPST